MRVHLPKRNTRIVWTETVLDVLPVYGFRNNKSTLLFSHLLCFWQYLRIAFCNVNCYGIARLHSPILLCIICNDSCSSEMMFYVGAICFMQPWFKKGRLEKKKSEIFLLILKLYLQARVQTRKLWVTTIVWRKWLMY